MEQRSLAFVSGNELLRRLVVILGQSRRVEADLIEHVAEVDARRLYLREGSPSMFAYCTEALHLSEAEGYSRITAARASRRHPALLQALREGRLHLTGIALLAPYLTTENEARLLARAEHKTKRQIEELIAEFAPKPDAPSLIRRLPGPAESRVPSLLRLADEPEPRSSFESDAPGSADPADPHLPRRPSTTAIAMGDASERRARQRIDRAIEPLAANRYKVQFTAGSGLRDKLERLRSLLRPAVPDGDLATVIERAVTEAIDRIEARRFGRTERPRPDPIPEQARRSRHVPAVVRRAVVERDGLQCGFVGQGGRRCSERGDLEYHHRHPWAMGGSHAARNVGLLCRAHNAWLAEHDYGRRVIRDAGHSQRRNPGS